MSTSEPSAVYEVVQRARQFFSLRRADIGALLRETVNAWMDDNAPRLVRIPSHENYHSELKKIIVPR